MAEVYVDPFEFVEEAYEPNRETVDFLESFMEELFGSDSDESGRIQWINFVLVIVFASHQTPDDISNVKKVLYCCLPRSRGRPYFCD